MVDQGSGDRLEHSQCKGPKLLGLCFRPESRCSCSEPGDVGDDHKLICSLSRSDSFLGLSFSKDIYEARAHPGGGSKIFFGSNGSVGAKSLS